MKDANLKLPKYTNRMIGADPEFFLVKPDGSPYPIVGLLGGTKEAPLQIPNMHPLFAYQEDNVMAEFNIPPCDNEDAFVEALCIMLREVMQRIPAEYELAPSFMPAYRFDPKFLDNKQACTFGCQPDMNAYTLESQRPKAKAAKNLRTAGGHIHIGWDESLGDTQQAASVARAFDLFVTLPLMLIEPENERRTLYGKAGSCRVKWYGVECRQPSCYWLSSTKLMRWIFQQTHKALDFCEQNEEIHDRNSVLCQQVQSVIDNKDMETIKRMVGDYHLQLV